MAQCPVEAPSRWREEPGPEPRPLTPPGRLSGKTFTVAGLLEQDLPLHPELPFPEGYGDGA